jgi:hypothetical protein
LFYQDISGSRNGIADVPNFLPRYVVSFGK